MTDLIAMGKAAKVAGRQLATLSTQKKNEALLAFADEIEAQGHNDQRNARDQGQPGMLEHIALGGIEHIAPGGRRVAAAATGHDLVGLL